MPARPTTTFLSARGASVRIAPTGQDLTEDREIEGLVGADALAFTDVEGYNILMDITGSKQYVRTSEQGTVVTMNLMASKSGHAKLSKLQKDQEAGIIGTVHAIVAYPKLGNIILEGGVITSWPPYPGFGDGEVGNLTYQITWTYFTANADSVGVGATGDIGIVQTEDEAVAVA